MDPLWVRVRQAATDGLVVGVKYSIALVVVAFVLTWALGDYAIVRQRALHGQIAFETLQQRASQPAK